METDLKEGIIVCRESSGFPYRTLTIHSFFFSGNQINAPITLTEYDFISHGMHTGHPNPPNRAPDQLFNQIVNSGAGSCTRMKF